MLSSADMDLGISLEIPQGSHSSNGVDMQVHIPHELEKQCQASFRVEIRISGFFSRCHRSVTITIVFHSILGVTVKSVQGSQVNLEWIGTSGSFGIVARPLEFPTKQGNGPLSGDEEGKPGLCLGCGGTLGVPLEWRRVCREPS